MLINLKSRRPDGDPVLDLADVCDIHDALIEKAEREQLAYDRAERKSKSGGT